jgi:GTPase SAR1 family protein
MIYKTCTVGHNFSLLLYVMEVTSLRKLPFPFSSGCTMGVFGPSGAGKSTFIQKILKNRYDMFIDNPTHILYCYGVYTPMYADIVRSIPAVQLHNGLPTLRDIETFADKTHKIIILDDLMDEISRNPWVDKLFTMYAHHWNLTVIFISQNLFTKRTRNITLNLKYIILFRSARDQLQISALGRQLGKGRELVAAYNDAVLNEEFNYLLIDLTPACPPGYRWRTHIFADESTIIYK